VSRAEGAALDYEEALAEAQAWLEQPERWAHAFEERQSNDGSLPTANELPGTTWLADFGYPIQIRALTRWVG
jgi:hypothetical protein